MEFLSELWLNLEMLYLDTRQAATFAPLECATELPLCRANSPRPTKETAG